MRTAARILTIAVFAIGMLAVAPESTPVLEQPTAEAGNANGCQSWSIESGQGRGGRCYTRAAGNQWRMYGICSNGESRFTNWRYQGYNSAGFLCDNNKHVVNWGFQLRTVGPY